MQSTYCLIIKPVKNVWYRLVYKMYGYIGQFMLEYAWDFRRVSFFLLFTFMCCLYPYSNYIFILWNLYFFFFFLVTLSVQKRIFEKNLSPWPEAFRIVCLYLLFFCLIVFCVFGYLTVYSIFLFYFSCSRKIDMLVWPWWKFIILIPLTEWRVEYLISSCHCDYWRI